MLTYENKPGRHTIYYMNIEVGRNKYYLHKRYTEFLMLHQVDNKSLQS